MNSFKSILKYLNDFSVTKNRNDEYEITIRFSDDGAQKFDTFTKRDAVNIVHDLCYTMSAGNNYCIDTVSVFIDGDENDSTGSISAQVVFNKE